VVARAIIATVTLNMRTDRQPIHDSLNILQAVIDATPDAIFVKDLEGRYVLINATAAKFLGRTPAEIIGRNDLELYPEETARLFIEADREVLATGQSKTFEGVATSEGTTQVFLVSKGVYRDQDGQIVGLFGISHDITQRRLSEAAIRQSEEYCNLFRLANDPIIIHDPETALVIDVNERACEAYGFPREVFIGTSLTALSRHPVACKDHWDRVVAEKTAPPLEAVQYRADGTPADFVISSSVVEYHGQPAVLSISRDVTERKRVDAELERTRDAALESLRVKSEFLANMSHEIRTPMNGILGMTELTLDTQLTSKQREYLEMVKVSADSLVGIIDDILDFSKIEAGRLTLDPIDFDLQQHLGATMKPLAIRAHQKGIELAYRVDADVPAMVIGDPNRLRQILVNLVGNAIKFTERGEVSLVVERGNTPGGSELHFSVSDTGMGVPAAKQSLIFEAFAQADGSTTRQHGGTGLGLAITSQLVELMGGRIWVESPVSGRSASEGGPGSTFHFTARMDCGSMRTSSWTSSPVAVHNLEVLIVDDNRTNRRILEEVLLTWHMKPTMVDSGEAALAEMKRMAAAGRPYQLVLLDAHMPEMDGFTVARTAHQMPELATSTILMLSSVDRDERADDLGLAAYLTKPINLLELRETVRRVFDAVPAAAQPESVGRAALASTRRLDVLLVDDMVINQRLAAALLNKRGHSVHIVSNGVGALAAVDAHAYDLVLMDVQMPEMSGFEATARIRERELTTGGHLPIVAMTAHAMKGDRERCLAAGMDGYVSKPIRFDDLWQEIARVLLSVPEPRPLESVRDAAPFNREALLECVDGDLDLARQIAELFLATTPGLLSEIRCAATHGDGPGLELAVQSLKAGVSYFSNAGTLETLERLETMGSTGDLGDSPALCLTLEEGVARLLVAIDEFRNESCKEGAAQLTN
jgi:two-component system sensor histidine kinase/response regulator